MKDLFRGERVYLAAENVDVMAEHFAHWGRDPEYARLNTSEPALPYSVKRTRQYIEKELGKDSHDLFFFLIRMLEDDRLIGFVALDGVEWSHGDSFVGIGIGESEYWGKGYGTEAMRLILRYAFTELNLRRLSLNVFEYNQRAIHSYEKAGFVFEGRARKFLNRNGRRWDLIFMGILREEWERNRDDTHT